MLKAQIVFSLKQKTIIKQLWHFSLHCRKFDYGGGGKAPLAQDNSHWVHVEWVGLFESYGEPEG